MIGYNGPQFANLAKNLPLHISSQNNNQKEYEAGQILHPFPTPPLSTSELGLVATQVQWRMVYLSTLVSLGINDFIDPSTYLLSYCSVDNAYSYFY